MEGRDRNMSYVIDGVERETDADGYLKEPDFGEEAVRVIAAAEGIALTDDHWKVVGYLRDKYRDGGNTTNFRNMVKELQDVIPCCDLGRKRVV
jgi:tRNA 2-thiouridine synthesizing protein E